jgi:hypothetical protein
MNSGFWKIVGIACRSASAASRSLRLVKNVSGTMTSPPGRSWTKVAKAISISRSVLAFRKLQPEAARRYLQLLPVVVPSPKSRRVNPSSPELAE